MNIKSDSDKLSLEEIEKNHNVFIKRQNLYKKYGFDHEETRRNVLRQLSGENSSILEIGTGKGILTTMLAGSFDRVLSVDIDSEELRIAKLNAAYFKQSDKIEFLTADAGSLGLPERSFDAVVSAFTFHHLEFPFKVIREMARVAINQIVISDFSSNGFKIVEQIHKLEGKTHTQLPGDFSIVGVYLKEFNFDVKIIEDEWQIIYVANRKI